MWCTQLLICSHAFPSLDSQSFDCIAVSAQGFVVDVFFFFFNFIHSFQITIFLIMSLIYAPRPTLSSPPAPPGQKMIFFEENKRIPLSLHSHQQSLLRNPDYENHFSCCLAVAGVHSVCRAKFANGASELEEYVTWR